MVYTHSRDSPVGAFVTTENEAIVRARIGFRLRVQFQHDRTGSVRKCEMAIAPSNAILRMQTLINVVCNLAP